MNFFNKIKIQQYDGGYRKEVFKAQLDYNLKKKVVYDDYDLTENYSLIFDDKEKKVYPYSYNYKINATIDYFVSGAYPFNWGVLFFNAYIPIKEEKEEEVYLWTYITPVSIPEFCTSIDTNMKTFLRNFPNPSSITNDIEVSLTYEIPIRPIYTIGFDYDYHGRKPVPLLITDIQKYENVYIDTPENSIALKGSNHESVDLFKGISVGAITEKFYSFSEATPSWFMWEKNAPERCPVIIPFPRYYTKHLSSIRSSCKFSEFNYGNCDGFLPFRRILLLNGDNMNETEILFVDKYALKDIIRLSQDLNLSWNLASFNNVKVKYELNDEYGQDKVEDNMQISGFTYSYIKIKDKIYKPTHSYMTRLIKTDSKEYILEVNMYYKYDPRLDDKNLALEEVVDINDIDMIKLRQEINQIIEKEGKFYKYEIKELVLKRYIPLGLKAYDLFLVGELVR